MMTLVQFDEAMIGLHLIQFYLVIPHLRDTSTRIRSTRAKDTGVSIANALQIRTNNGS